MDREGNLNQESAKLIENKAKKAKSCDGACLWCLDWEGSDNSGMPEIKRMRYIQPSSSPTSIEPEARKRWRTGGEEKGSTA